MTEAADERPDRLQQAARSGSPAVGPIAVTPTQAAQLKAGQWYFNLHSTTFSGGEIRGPIDNIQFRDGFE